MLGVDVGGTFIDVVGGMDGPIEVTEFGACASGAVVMGDPYSDSEGLRIDKDATKKLRNN